MALTEIVDIVPIFSRRVRLKRGMPALILSMALGRTFGALFYYYLRL
jgi:stage V sporulation protein AB